MEPNTPSIKPSIKQITLRVLGDLKPIEYDDRRNFYVGKVKVNPVDVDDKILFVKEIKDIGKRNGLKLEVCWAPIVERFIIFATNNSGVRYEFLRVEEFGNKFKPLNRDVVNEVEKIIHICVHGNQVKFYKEMAIRQQEAKEKGLKEIEDRLAYMTAQYRRTFIGMHRCYGGGIGKHFSQVSSALRSKSEKEGG